MLLLPAQFDGVVLGSIGELVVVEPLVVLVVSDADAAHFHEVHRLKKQRRKFNENWKRMKIVFVNGKSKSEAKFKKNN